ncbi:MAG: zinc-ribbon domain-containing protein [Thermomicrobiales bacterium]
MTARDPSTSAAQRICPKCGHANSNISLFCAECGAVLNGALDDGGSNAYAPSSQAGMAGTPMNAADDSQGTQPIRTTTSTSTGEQDWATMMAGSADDANATAPLPRMTPPVSSVTPPPAAPTSGPSYESPPPTWMTPSESAAASAPLLTSSVSFGLEEEPHHSMRGFWFGVVAFLLILAVLGLYGWSILPDGGFRDTVTGWF